MNNQKVPMIILSECVVFPGSSVYLNLYDSRSENAVSQAIGPGGKLFFRDVQFLRHKLLFHNRDQRIATSKADHTDSQHSLHQSPDPCTSHY